MKTSPAVLALCCLLAASCNNSRKAVSDADSSPVNKRWVLRELPGTELPAQEKDIYFTLRTGTGKMDGFGGCNRMGGSYELKGDRLKFGPVISTKMWCNNGPVEQKVFGVLDSTNRYEMKGDVLRLYHDQDLLARFEALYLH